MLSLPWQHCSGVDEDGDDDNSAAFLKKCPSTQRENVEKDAEWEFHFGDMAGKEVDREKKMAGNPLFTSALTKYIPTQNSSFGLCNKGAQSLQL